MQTGVHQDCSRHTNTRRLHLYRVLSLEQTVGYLKVSEETVENLRRVGTLRPVGIGRHDRWLVIVLMGFLEMQRT